MKETELLGIDVFNKMVSRFVAINGKQGWRGSVRNKPAASGIFVAVNGIEY